jgi:sigma-E factor negative regulatory protein RseB
VGYDADTAGRWNPGGEFAGAARLSGYQAHLGRVERIANRDAQVIDLRARDTFRYGYRLWLDKQTAFPLRIALIGEGGRPLEQIAFTDLKLGVAPVESDLRASSEQGLQRVQTLNPGPDVDPGWRVLAPPPGFSLRSARQLGGAVQLLYSDGLANVSVYIEPALTGQRSESALRRGAVNVHSIVQGGRRIVAIGKVPAATTAYFVRNAQTSLTPTSLQARH